MLATILAVLIVTTGGTLLTFLFERPAPLPARVCLGAIVGLTLFAYIGYGLAVFVGLSGATVALSCAASLLPFCLLAKASFRDCVNSEVRHAASSFSARLKAPDRRTAAYVFVYLAVTVVLGLLFGRAAFHKADGIYTGLANNLGDLPLHLQVINSFTQGNNFPPQDPTYAGIRFTYPFIADSLTAMLVRTGAPIIGAMWLQNTVLALVLVGLLHYWTLLLTRDRRAGLIAPLLVLFSGGLGWWWLLSDLANSGNILETIGRLPRDYTIVPETILRWGNSLTTLFVTQRSMLLGLPLAIFVFVQWWNCIDQNGVAILNGPQGQTNTKSKKGKAKRDPGPATTLPSQSKATASRRMLAAGLMAGLMPLVHAHSFLVIMGAAACLAVLFRQLWRSWVVFFVSSSVLAIPQVLWLARAGGVKAQSFLGWQIGWDHGTHNVIWFWLVNTGLFIPLLIAAVVTLRRVPERPSAFLKFYLPFAFCFVVPNFIKLAPWTWDNIKVLFYWYVGSAPIIAWLLARWWRQRSYFRAMAAMALAVLVLAGALDVWRAISGATEYLEFDIHAIAVAKSISEQAAPRATVLHAPTYNTPVFLTGRQSLLGYPGWMWSRGLDWTERSTEIAQMYAGGPEAKALLSRYRVEYVLIGPAERTSLAVNEAFWSEYPKVMEAGSYRLYRTELKVSEVK